MKQFITNINWKNFLQRTVLFFIVFLLIRLAVDWWEGDVSLLRTMRLSMVRYLLFAIVLGFLDSETWTQFQKSSSSQKEPVVFKSRSAAFFHYAGVAFFVALLCGLILFLFSSLRWLINYIAEGKKIALFPDWGSYVIVILLIGICFAAFDAWTNHRQLKKRS
jgi:hypothetical protein